MPLNNCFPCIQFRNEEVITKQDFSSTVLTDVFPDVWQYERTLEELYLTSTRINNLPPQLFYCQSLRILMVNSNNLESLPNAIGSLRHLQQLNLSRNLISNIPDNIKTCKNLTHLDISCNNLQRLPDAITCLISLQELLLNETYLEFLPANFGRLVNLKILELRLNNLITLPKSMARLCNLQRLDIGGNEFTELPEVIGELKQLRELWIDFNQIRRISPNIAKLCELQHFETNGNLIDSLPNEISNWRNIEVLSICTNNLDSLPFSIGMMRSLVTFKCESNELRELPDSISNLENLEELVLSHNQLTRLPTTIGMLRKLRFLFADGNELRALPDEICSCSSLSVLSISRNRITELPQNIGQLTKLKVINLVSNYIASLPVSILSLVNLTSLWISDNQSQPLVPLQYLDANTKTKLTCFMLPQTGARMNRPSEQSLGNNFIEQQDYAGQLSDKQHPKLFVPPNQDISQSRRICFAAEATILTAMPQPCTDANSKENECSIGASVVNTDEEQLSVRLMRSPTPYPKELRLMAKYVRNGPKIPQKPSELLDVKKALVMSNSNNCDKIFRNNVEQTILRNGALTEGVEEISIGSSQPINEFYSITQPPESQLVANCSQIFYAPQSDANQVQLRLPHFYEPPNSNFIYSQNMMQSTACNDHQEQSSALGCVCSNLQPPPYHIARIFTKKSPEDLTNYEAMRYQLQTQYYPNAAHDPQKRDISDQLSNSTATREMENFSNELNSNCELYHHQFSGSNSSQPPSNCDYLNNVLGASLEPNAQTKIVVHDHSHVTDSTTNQHDPHQELNRSLSEVSINSCNSMTKSQVSNGCKAKSKATPWLFGVHKNPTVKQVTIKWENHVGFEISKAHHKEGIYVSSLLPNSSASRLLCVEDKLLEIDGYDLTKINLNDAQKILKESGAVINVMLSRE